MTMQQNSSHFTIWLLIDFESLFIPVVERKWHSNSVRCLDIKQSILIRMGAVAVGATSGAIFICVQPYWCIANEGLTPPEWESVEWFSSPPFPSLALTRSNNKLTTIALIVHLMASFTDALSSFAIRPLITTVVRELSDACVGQINPHIFAVEFLYCFTWNEFSVRWNSARNDKINAVLFSEVPQVEGLRV